MSFQQIGMDNQGILQKIQEPDPIFLCVLICNTNLCLEWFLYILETLRQKRCFDCFGS